MKGPTGCQIIWELNEACKRMYPQSVSVTKFGLFTVSAPTAAAEKPVTLCADPC